MYPVTYSNRAEVNNHPQSNTMLRRSLLYLLELFLGTELRSVSTLLFTTIFGLGRKTCVALTTNGFIAIEFLRQ